MKLLVDECIDQRLRHEFPLHECQTARYANFAGLQNGVLLRAAENAGFDVLLTVDGSIPYQQNLSGRGISIVILSAPTNRLEDLTRLVPAIHVVLKSIRPGEVVRVPA